MRTGIQHFVLMRDEDEVGVSGTGVVADGVIFAGSGKVALSWNTPHTSVAVYDDLETVIAIHGHDGKTKVLLDDHVKRYEKPDF